MSTAPTYRGRVRAFVVAALLTAATAGCSAPESITGPAEVSVRKSTAAAPTEQVAKLTEFDPDATPGAASVTWGTATEHLWLPQAVEVVAGINGTTDEAGTAYLKVPAKYATTADKVAAEQQSKKFTGYVEINVPHAAPPPDAKSSPGPSATTPAGKVIQGVRDQVKYTLTVSPDPDEPKFSVVMVKWEPYQDPASELDTGTGEAHDDH